MTETESDRPDGNLVAHARRELALIGEEPDVIDWYVSVVRAFASYGHSGGAARASIPVLEALLRYRNLTPLTDAPAEWIDRTDVSSIPMWQNCRDSTAFSEDGGKTYWLLAEREASGSLETTPVHKSEPAAVRAG